MVSQYSHRHLNCKTHTLHTMQVKSLNQCPTYSKCSINMSWSLLCTLIKAKVHWVFQLHHTCDLRLCHYFYNPVPSLSFLPLTQSQGDRTLGSVSCHSSRSAPMNLMLNGALCVPGQSQNSINSLGMVLWNQHTCLRLEVQTRGQELPDSSFVLSKHVPFAVCT